jgi:dinuclear metal center YbgI/SA1388 family protein
MPLVADIADFMNQLAPLSLAAEWDNVGLLLGEAAAPVSGIMTCLTVTPETAAEAMEAKASLIISHHPILFRAAKRLTGATAEGRMLLGLARAGIAVYSPHTAFDNCAGGINDVLAQRLGLTNVVALRDGNAVGRCKIVVFVPEADLAKVMDALFAAGAGHIGQYSQCSFRLAGTGTFFGSDTTQPTAGQKGRREEVSEFRLEAICPNVLVDGAIQAMRRAHSYEEPAYDVYPLRSDRDVLGVGRVGNLTAPTTLSALAELTRARLAAAASQFVGDPVQRVERVAIACGAGGEFVGDAIAQKADALLTGEARFHDCLAAQAQGLGLILPGHYASERCGVEELARRLQSAFPDISVWASQREADPLRHL